MSKINQIQQAILEMGGGEFQKMADAYLMEKGFELVSSYGSVAGKNKVRRGTPDTIMKTPEGNFILVEYTTQQSGLLGKMKDDLSKCLDDKKTGIPIHKIDRIIFCFTSNLDTDGVNELIKACQKVGVNLDLISLDKLSFDLYQKYPGLARDFLGITIDTGQIVTPKKFIDLYNKNKLSTRIDLNFHFREDELNRLLMALDQKNLVVLSGKAGIGKTRLALETCYRFSVAHPEYMVMCIFGRNRDLWEDLQTWFSKPGSYLIFVDDANRVSEFEYIIDLLQHQHKEQEIKVIATVRDYAASKVREVALPLGEISEVGLKAFTDEQIRELVTSEFGITNYHYLERITDIARGNPRLAVMAAEVAKKGPLSSINDVSALYDRYFSSIREDITAKVSNFVSENMLKVAAIVSFFKAVDRSNLDMMSDIEQAFKIGTTEFWEAAYRLHTLEILDMYENEVVKLSDQVIGTYLFYLAVFREMVLDFGTLMVHFFPKLKHQIIDSINPILSAFDSFNIIKLMRPHIECIWSNLEGKGDTNGLIDLIDTFWFTRETETLLWARSQIQEMESEPVEISDINFEKNSGPVPTPSILSILGHFAFVEAEDASTAVNLLLRYLIKRPSEAPLLLRILIDDYGFRFESYLRRYEIQRLIVDTVWAHAQEGNLLFSRLFLSVAKNFLSTEFESNKMKDEHMFQSVRFKLPVTTELNDLRMLIWNRLFVLYENDTVSESVLEVISHYSTSRDRVNHSDVIKNDSAYVLPFLETVLRPELYHHCVIMNDYLDLLEEHNGKSPDGLRDRYQNDTYKLAEILLTEWGQQQVADLSYEDYQKYKLDRLSKYTAQFKFDDYSNFFQMCLEIKEVPNKRRNDYQLQSQVMNTLQILSDRDAKLFSQVLQHYLSLQDPFNLHGYTIVKRLLEQQGYEKAFELISEPEFPTKRRWLFYLYQMLPAEAVDKAKLHHLYELYRTSDKVDLPYDMDYLLKFHHIDPQVVTTVVSIILEKTEKDPDFAFSLTMLFTPHTEVAKKLSSLFQNDIGLLKQAYFAADNTQNHDDHDGNSFNSILNLDTDFITEYLDWKYSNAKHGWLNIHDEYRNYDFIWVRQDYSELMHRVTEGTYGHERNGYLAINPYLGAFFSVQEKSKPEMRVQKKQDSFLLRLINDRNTDVEFMRYLFRIIAQFEPERRLQFIRSFLQCNDDFEVFEQLPLETGSGSANGSWVPVLQKRVDYWESLLPLMNSVDLLQHKQYVEHNIQVLQAEIEREKKRDFIGY